MAGSPASVRKGRCPGCGLPPEACLCRGLTRLPNRTEVRIYRHAKESFKTSNTGRLAALLLERCEIHEYGRPHQPIDPPGLANSWLLFPSSSPQIPPGRPARLVVLDGTWSQARRMVQRLPWLRALPRLSLLPEHPPDGLRREPDAVGMPTVLAIARALELLEGPALGEALEALHAEFVHRARALRGGPAVLKLPAAPGL